jgi:protein SCO1/2
MKTALNIVLILFTGIAIGLAVRSFRSPSSVGPAPGDEVFSNENALVDNESVQP